MEDWVTIRNLKRLNASFSNRQIGKLLHISKTTVKRALENDEGPNYERKPTVNIEIEPFIAIIEEKLTVQKLLRSRVLSDIISKGYKGSQSAFYRYVSKNATIEKRTFHPYETSPGEQAQFDWSPYTLVINGELTRIYIFSYILGFSRYRIYEASLSQSLSSTFEALENSIIETTGIPERIQTDNACCFIINASRDNLTWNSRYLQLCGHYRIKPTRSLPGHPWSKGKVERPFNFLEEHFIKGNEFESFEEFCKRLKTFQEEVNNRVHHTTNQTPKYLFDKELESLGLLPAGRFVDIKEQVRKVTADCLIQFEGSRYSVPYLFATKEVWLKVSKGYRLQIYSSQNQLIAEHVLSLVKKAVIINEEHYKNHNIERGNWNRLSQSFLRFFPDFEWFPEKLKAQKRINPNYHLTQILEIIKYYNFDDVKNTFSACLQYNVYSYSFIKGHLENHGRVEIMEPIPIDKKILETIESVSIKRPLTDYKLINYQ